MEIVDLHRASDLPDSKFDALLGILADLWKDDDEFSTIALTKICLTGVGPYMPQRAAGHANER